MMRTTDYGRWGVLILAALTVIALTCCKGKKSSSDDDEPGTEKKDSTEIDRVLAQFPPAPDLNDYHPNGHSHAFEIHPRPELTISAPAGAFEQDVQIQVTDVPQVTMQQLRQRLDEENYGDLAWAYDIDAGLPPDSVIPGKYTVSIDLKKKKVPEELYPYLWVVRVGADGCTQILNSHIEDDHLVYHASRNSISAVCVFACIAVATTGSVYIVNYPRINQGFRRYSEAIGAWEWYHSNDVVVHQITDPYCRFDLYYRYSDTENNLQTQKYLRDKAILRQELIRIKYESREEILRQHPNLRQGGEGAEEFLCMNAGVLAEKMKKESTEINNILASGILNPPASVEALAKAAKQSHRYIQKELKMKPLTVSYTLYLSPALDAMNAEGTRTRYVFFDPFVVLNYDMIVLKEGENVANQYMENSIPGAMITMTHETMHVYQTEYLDCQLFKDLRFFEAMGGACEYRFARWLLEQYPSMRAVLTLSENYADRSRKELLSWPLAYDYPRCFGMGPIDANTDGGYMLADMLDYMNATKEKKNFEQMMQGYDHTAGFLGSLKAVWGIADDRAFLPYFEKFCQKHIKEICARQAKYSSNPSYTSILTDRKQDAHYCVTRLWGHELVYKQGKGASFCAKALRINAKPIGNSQLQPYNLYAKPSRSLEQRLLKFSFLEGTDLTCTQDPFYIKPCRGDTVPTTVQAIVYTRPDIENEKLTMAYYIDLVALYKPAQAPVVKCMSNNGTGLLVDTRVAPSVELTRYDEPYVTGMQLLVTNNKTGLYKGFSVALPYCGQEVKIPYDSIGVTDKNDVDLTLQSRWYYAAAPGKNYYSPATDKVHYVLKDEHEQQSQQQTTQGEGDEPTSFEESQQDQGDGSRDTLSLLNYPSVQPC